MRHESEIKRAHDLLGNILAGVVPTEFVDEKGDKLAVKVCFMTLCWCLDHRNCDGAAQMIDQMIVSLGQQLRDAGYVLPCQNLPHQN